LLFQAEDGIRDWSVTGVQTCALPIWAVDAVRRVAEARSTLADRQHALTEWREGLAAAERLHTEHAVRATQAAERCRAAETARTRSEERRVGKEGRGRGARGP